MYGVIDGKTRKIKKNYGVINGVTKAIKKIYAVVGGITKLIFKGGELTYYGTATNLSLQRYNLAATSVGNYAIFAGGYNSTGVGTAYNTVDAYNSSLSRTTPSALSEAVEDLVATTVGSYALFGGGGNGYSSDADAYYDSSYYPSAFVHTYNTSLTRGRCNLSIARTWLAATSVGDYALFGGGRYYSGYINYDVVDAFNSSLTRSTPAALSYAVYYNSATSVGNYAIFAGGTTGSSTHYVDAYDTSLTKTTVTQMSNSIKMAATSVGNYAIFAGGGMGSYPVNTVFAFNSSLTQISVTSLNTAKNGASATSVGDYAIIAGGRKGTTFYSDVDVYDSSLTRTTGTSLSAAKGNLAATSIGNYALFAGGYGGGTVYNTVDVYTVG